MVVTFVEMYGKTIEYGKRMLEQGYELMQKVEGLGVEVQLSELEKITQREQ